MTKMPEYDRGYRDGVRHAVTWLARRAVSMNDPSAKRILDSAATNLGWECAGRPIAAPALYADTLKDN